MQNDQKTHNCLTAIHDVTQGKSQTYRPVRASRVERRAGQAGHGLYTQTPLSWRLFDCWLPLAGSPGPCHEL